MQSFLALYSFDYPTKFFLNHKTNTYLSKVSRYPKEQLLSLTLNVEIRQFNNPFFFYYSFKNYKQLSNFINLLISTFTWLRTYFLNVWKKTAGEGLTQLQVSATVFYVDALLTDDEPIWEPVEWSLIQTWIFFTFLFGWIAENLISSRYGSYTGRDKRVWFAWYKNAWIVIGWYTLSIGAATLFVVTPFYHEVSSLLPLTVSWWDWYSRTFFTNFITFYTLLIFIGVYLQITTRVFNWKKSWNLILLINLALLFLLYGQFLTSFFSYTTDPNWYHKTRLIDYVQLSHEPNKWSWGSAKRDHFAYHKSSTVFWFKNDGPFGQALLLTQLFVFWGLFGISFFWLTLIRRVYAVQEVSFTFITYAVSFLKQFFYFFLLFFVYIIFSYITSYWRLPLEFLWAVNYSSWLSKFLNLVGSYTTFLNIS